MGWIKTLTYHAVHDHVHQRLIRNSKFKIQNRCRRFLLVGLIFCFINVALAQDPNPPTIHSKHGAWPLRRQWNPAETQHYAQWIERIYEKKTRGTLEQRLAKLERVLTDPEMNLLLDPAFAGEEANPQLDVGTIRAMHGILDCGKLTVAFSAYYAYRRGLPWMISHVRSCDGTDLRTADYTIPSGSTSSFDYGGTHGFFVDAITSMCTGNFRVPPDGKNAEMSDTVPVAIDRKLLLPGCMFYLDGHVLVLASIDKFGEPHFLDATTAASRDIYAYNSLNAVTGISPKQSKNAGREYAGCYRGFRVLRYPVAEVDDDGNVRRVRRRTDAEMREFGYSTEQYDKLEEFLEQRRLTEGGFTVDNFHEFIRLRLRTAERINIAEEIQSFAEQMRALLEFREQRVQEAWRDVQENGPVAFPEGRDAENVFSVRGRWGALSTAITDVEWRARYFELIDCIDNAIPWFDRMMEYVDLKDLNRHAIWNHADLAEAVLRAKKRIFEATRFAYVNSQGQQVPLTLLDVEQRLYDLSFDPNHPPELRWGAALGSPEAQTATEMPTPLPDGTTMPMEEAYRREAYYRSLLHRPTDASYLRKMFTDGFPMRQKFDESVGPKYKDQVSPPLVPHNGKAAWLKQQGAQK